MAGRAEPDGRGSTHRAAAPAGHWCGSWRTLRWNTPQGEAYNILTRGILLFRAFGRAAVGPFSLHPILCPPPVPRARPAERPASQMGGGAFLYIVYIIGNRPSGAPYGSLSHIECCKTPGTGLCGTVLSPAFFKWSRQVCSRLRCLVPLKLHRKNSKGSLQRRKAFYIFLILSQVSTKTPDFEVRCT